MQLFWLFWLIKQAWKGSKAGCVLPNPGRGYVGRSGANFGEVSREMRRSAYAPPFAQLPDAGSGLAFETPYHPELVDEFKRRIPPGPGSGTPRANAGWWIRNIASYAPTWLNASWGSPSPFRRWPRSGSRKRGRRGSTRSGAPRTMATGIRAHSPGPITAGQSYSQRRYCAIGSRLFPRSLEKAHSLRRPRDQGDSHTRGGQIGASPDGQAVAPGRLSRRGRCRAVQADPARL